MKIKLTLIVFLFLFSVKYTIGQGCSDAGVCTAGTLATTTGDTGAYKTNIVFGANYGLGEEFTHIITPQVALNVPILKYGVFQVKLPIVFTTGRLGNGKGIGDLSINYSHNFRITDSISLSVLAGIRLASNNATIAFPSSHFSLPMPYQSSLGTDDIIVGASLKTKKWAFTVGYQKPITHKNQNSFRNDGSDAHKGFVTTIILERQPDVIARVERRFMYKEIEMAASVLSIYHVANDIQGFRGNFTRIPRGEIEGSKGLTINLTLKGGYRINENFRVSALLGFPVIFRETRADGLTRFFVLSPAIQWFL